MSVDSYFGPEPWPIPTWKAYRSGLAELGRVQSASPSRVTTPEALVEFIGSSGVALRDVCLGTLRVQEIFNTKDPIPPVHLRQPSEMPHVQRDLSAGTFVLGLASLESGKPYVAAQTTHNIDELTGDRSLRHRAEVHMPIDPLEHPLANDQYELVRFELGMVATGEGLDERLPFSPDALPDHAESFAEALQFIAETVVGFAPREPKYYR